MKAEVEGEPPGQWTRLVRTSSLDDFRRLRQSASYSAELHNPPPPTRGNSETNPDHALRRNKTFERSLNCDSVQTQFTSEDSIEDEYFENGSSIPKLTRSGSNTGTEDNGDSTIPMQFCRQGYQSTFIDHGRSLSTPHILHNTLEPIEQWTGNVLNNNLNLSMEDDSLRRSLKREEAYHHSMYSSFDPNLYLSDANSSKGFINSLESDSVVAVMQTPSLFSVHNIPKEKHLVLPSLWSLSSENSPVQSSFSATRLTPFRSDCSRETLGVPVRQGIPEDRQLTAAMMTLLPKKEEILTAGIINESCRWCKDSLTPTSEQTNVFQSSNGQCRKLSRSPSAKSSLLTNPFPHTSVEQASITTPLSGRHRLAAPGTTLSRTPVQNEPPSRQHSFLPLNSDHRHSTVSLEDSPGNLRNDAKGQDRRLKSLDELSGLKNGKNNKSGVSSKRERIRTWEGGRRQTSSKRRAVISCQDSETQSGRTSTSNQRCSRLETRGRTIFPDMVRAGVIKTGPQIWTVGHDANIHVIVKSDGCILYKDEKYNSLSSFALAVIRERNPCRLACDGWKDVKYEGKRLDSLREMYLYCTPTT